MTAANRVGRRIPLPLVGPQWSVARLITGTLGAPIPEHVLELLQHGRLADTSAAADRLGLVPVASTRQVIDRLYTWPSVVRQILNEWAKQGGTNSLSALFDIAKALVKKRLEMLLDIA